MYIRDDGEVIASSIQLNVNGCFRNKAKFSFAEDKVRPGNPVDYKLSASSGSTCFVGMVDKSVMLLGGNNQLSPKDIFEQVGNVARTYSYHSYYEEDRDYCQNQIDETSEYNSYWLRPEGEDSMTAFRDVRMAVISDGLVQTRPCKEQPRYYYSIAGGGFSGQSGGGIAVPLSSEVDNGPVTVEAGKKTEVKVEKIRSFFPETWLWDIVTLGESETELTVTTNIPDTITEWVGNTLCTNHIDGVGVSDIVGVTAFQPFFVSLTLPYSAVRGETLPVVVTVFNYLEDCIPMRLTFSELEGFRFRDSGSSEKEFCLCGGDSETYKFYIIPTVVGEIDIEVTAVSVENNGMCKDVKLSELATGVSDGVQRQLLIEAEGVPEEKTWSSYICVKENVDEARLAEWSLPKDMVPDSYRATASVVGDVMGPTLSNLKNLLRMPYGCGEQNMASWAPNIYVLQYLSNTNQLVIETENEAKNYMSVGYQRQMNYRHVDNSYSAWGENEYNNATGSLWLTAFVVKSMAQSSAFISVDIQDIIKSATWLVEKQDENGCFPKYGKVFSSYMKGGLDSDNLAGLTAFTLIALLEADLGDEFEPYVSEGFNCLDMYDVFETDTYTLSVMLYAYTLRANPRRYEVMDMLQRRKVSSNGVADHWKREETEEEKENTNNWYWYRAPSAEVEMTAYVLLSMLEEDFDVVDAESHAIVQWLTKQRNPYGGFSSTQDTVVALQALAKFGQQTYTGSADITVEIVDTDNVYLFHVTDDNSLVTQSADLVGADNSVVVTVTGSGCLLAQVSMKYNVYQEENTGPAFRVRVDVFRSTSDKNNCAMRTLSVCARYLKSAVSNMAIAEVKMPTGWIPVKNSLRQLVKNNEVQKMEVDKNYVQLYFDELMSGVDTCVSFEVEQDIRMKPKPALLKVYDYYETSYSVTTKYEIRTTCGTKEEIPLDNAGLDCSIMQCRNVDPPEPQTMSCPACPRTMEADEVTQLACESTSIYKAIVGREGDYSMKLKSDVRQKKKHNFDQYFVNHNMDEKCSCPILDKTDARALIFTNSKNILNGETLTLKEGVTVLLQTRSFEKIVRTVATRKKLCGKLERLRRSGTRRSMSKLALLMTKHKL